MTTRLALLGAAAAALALCLGAGAYAGPTEAPVNVFTDPAGDAIGAAPDVTGFSYWMNAAGVVTFAITTALTPGTDTFVSVLIDSDGNPSTGDARFHGAEYEIEYHTLQQVAVACVWDSAQQAWVDAPDDPNLGYTADARQVVLSFGRKALGDPGTAQAAVLTGVVDPDTFIHFLDNGDAEVDRAPDDGADAVVLEPLSLALGSLTHSPPKANSRFSVSMTAVRSDSHQYVGPGDGGVTCTLTVAGKRQAPVGWPQISDGVTPTATCAWKLGKKAKGKLLRLTITVEAGGASVTRRYAARIR